MAEMEPEDRGRLMYKPEKISILLLGEAPAVGARRFYLGNTNLFRTVKAAFSEMYGEFGSNDEFLDLFKSLGCYTDHLSPVPVHKEDLPARKAAREKGVLSLAARLKEYQPEIVIILMKDLVKQITESVEMSGVKSIRIMDAVPYPAGSDTNRRNCIAGIVGILKRAEIEI